MYAVFANVRKNNTISSIKLKKVLSSSSQYYSFDSLQSRIETDKVYVIKINKNKITKKTLLLILENGLSGLYFINKLDPQTKDFRLAVPEMLFKDYKTYMKLFKKEFKNIKKKSLFYKTNIGRNIHILLKERKLNASGLINLIIANILDVGKIPTNFTMNKLKALNEALDNKGKKNSCVLGSDQYFSIKPNPCKTYFKFDADSIIKSYSKKKNKNENEVNLKLNIFDKKKKRKRKRRPSISKSSSTKSSRSSTSGVSTGVGSIDKVMGKPKLKTNPPTVSKTELRMKLKNDKIKMKKLESKILMNSLMKKGKLEKETFTIKSNNKSKLGNFIQSFVILFCISFFLRGSNNIMFKILKNVFSFPIKLIEKLCKK